MAFFFFTRHRPKPTNSNHHPLNKHPKHPTRNPVAKWHRGPPIRTDAWEEKKVMFDEKAGSACPQVAQIKCRGKGYERIRVKRILAIRTKAEFSYALVVMDKIGGWEEGDGQEEWVCSRCSASVWIYTKAAVCNAKEMCRLSGSTK